MRAHRAPGGIQPAVSNPLEVPHDRAHRPLPLDHRLGRGGLQREEQPLVRPRLEAWRRRSRQQVDPRGALGRRDLSPGDREAGIARGELDALRAEHSDAVTQLQTRVRQLGGTASTEAGVWGEFAKAVEGTAKVFGNEAAISALKTGELHGVTEYEDAVADASLDAESKSLIRDTLLPRQRGHAERLDRAKP